MRIKFHPAFAVYLFCIAALSSFTDCLSILLTLTVHEFSHYIACTMTGEQIEQLELTPFGGIMIYKAGTCSHKGLKGVIANAAGPIGNYLFLLCIRLPSIRNFASYQLLQSLIISNTSMLLLNLLPVLPLDGGHIAFCLGYYFFPVAKLIRVLSIQGIAAGIAGLMLSAYGLFFRQILNCSLLIVSGYMIFTARQSQKTLLAQNIYAVVHERSSAVYEIRRMERYQVTANTRLYELIPCLKEGCSLSFFFQEGEQYLELTEDTFCHALCACAFLSVKEAYQRFALSREKPAKNPENTLFPS